MPFPHRPFILAWCIVILALVLTACGGGSPSATSPTATSAPTATPTPAAPADLVPLPDASGSFCRFDTSGHITLTIKNQGAGDAAASRAEVKYFTQSGSSSISADTTFSVAPIAAGHSLDKTTNLFNLPDERNIPGTLTITVNLGNQIPETNSSNNTVTSQCK